MKIHSFVVSSVACLGISILFCQSLQAQTLFEARLDASQVVSTTSTTTATGFATFQLSADESQLDYQLLLDGLDLKPSDRTSETDVVAIHLHSGAAGTPGPHVLNIFGAPSEDDDDLAINFPGNSLGGSWDDGDVVDPTPAGQSMGGTTKFLSNFIDELNAGNLYLAVHNYNGMPGAGDVAIRGQLIRVPEPGSVALLLMGCCLLSRRRL